MRFCKTTAAIGLLVIISLFFSSSFAEEKRFIINYKEKDYSIGVIRTNHVKLQSLQKLFDFQYSSGSDTTFIMVDGMRYSNGVVFLGGTYYVPIDEFLDFFLVKFRFKNNTYTINNKGIWNPQKLSIETKTLSMEKISNFPIETFQIDGSIFIEGDSFASFSHRRLTVSESNGTAKINNIEIPRWIKYNNRYFLFKDDVEKAVGIGISLKKPEAAQERKPDSSESAEKSREIRNNLRILISDSSQYPSMNPAAPIRYLFVIRINNNFREPIQIHPYNFQLIDQQGQEENTYSLSALPGVTSNFLSYFTVQGNDQGILVVEFLPPANFSPKMFIMEYEGVLLMQTSVIRSIVP